MRFLVAPNAFKGSLSARRAAGLIAAGLRRGRPGCSCELMPISDGGDGLMEVLLARRGGRRVPLRVTGPLGRPLTASYAILRGGKTAVVEMARASGLALVAGRRLDPLGATSYGTGQLIADALRRGCRRVLVGLGGSATSDGGAGLAAALGARLLDASGRELPPGAEPLRRLASVDARALRRRLGSARFIGVTDVRNPLLGPRGSARVFGPQKGATPAQVRVLEQCLRRYARVLERDLGRAVARLPGAGAAGGLGAGLAAFLRARLVPGAEFVLRELGAPARLERARAAFTGEGRLDEQSFFGKAPLEFARLARARGVPVYAFCGELAPGLERRLRRAGIVAAVPLRRPGEPLPRALRAAGPRLARAAAALAPALLAAALCVSGATAQEASTAAPVAASTAAFYAEVDRLYLHRHQGENLKESTERLKARLKDHPDDAQALWRFGRNVVRIGERKEERAERVKLYEYAERLLERSVELDPRDAEAHFWSGLALGRRGQARGIFQSLFMIKPLKQRMRRVMELDPKHGGAHHVLGRMYLELPRFAGGSPETAARELLTAMRLSPDFTAHYPALAEAYLKLGEKGKAKQVLEAFAKVTEPSDPAVHAEHKAEVERLLAELK